MGDHPGNCWGSFSAQTLLLGAARALAAPATMAAAPSTRTVATTTPTWAAAALHGVLDLRLLLVGKDVARLDASLNRRESLRHLRVGDSLQAALDCCEVRVVRLHQLAQFDASQLGRRSKLHGRLPRFGRNRLNLRRLIIGETQLLAVGQQPAEHVPATGAMSASAAASAAAVSTRAVAAAARLAAVASHPSLRAVALTHASVVASEAFASPSEAFYAGAVIRIEVVARSILREPDRANQQRATERCRDQNLR